MTALPDKPSELIELALRDLEKAEAMPDVYEITMATWHAPKLDEIGKPIGVCRVCLAGSVLAQTLGVDPRVRRELSQSPGTNELDEDTWRKLRCLNDLREGDVPEALYELQLIDYKECIRRQHDNDRFKIVDYDEDPAQFKADMRELAAELREDGL